MPRHDRRRHDRRNDGRPAPNLPPHRGFAHPLDIVEAPLSPALKLRLLRDWEQDLRALLVASDENMSGPEPGRAGELLSGVRRAIAALDRNTEAPARAAPPRRSRTRRDEAADR